MKTDNQSHKKLSDLGPIKKVRFAGSEANIFPSFLRVEHWKADSQYYVGTPERPLNVFAQQEILAQENLGVMFVLSVDDTGQLKVVNGYAKVNEGVHTGQNLNVTDVQWEPSIRLSFNFAFSFFFEGVTYTFSDGRFEFRFD